MRFLSAGLLILFSIGCTKPDVNSVVETLPSAAARQTSPGTSPSILQWQKCLGSNAADESRAMIRTSDGGFIIAANTTGSNNGDVTTTNMGGYDAWLVKLNTNGSVEWAKTYGTSQRDWILDVEETAGGYVFVGSSYKNTSDGDGWIAMVDFNGNLSWQNKLGGSAYDAFSKISVDANGEIVVVGDTRSTDYPDVAVKGADDIWIAKFNSDGHLLYSKAYGGSTKDIGHSILTEGANYVIAGISASTDGDLSGILKTGGDDIWMFQIEATTGALIQGSQRIYGGSAEESYPKLFRNPGSAGGYFLAASTLSNDGNISGNKGSRDGWVARLDGSLNIIGTGKCFGGTNDDAFRAGYISENEMVLTGFSYSKTGDLASNKGSSDVWILKMDHNLNKQNSSSFGGRGLEIGWGIAPAGEGYMIAGRTDANNGDVTGFKGVIDVWLLNIKY